MRLRLILCVLALVVLAALVMPVTADEVDDLLSDLKYGDSWSRVRAINQLGNIGDNRAVDPLIDALGDKNTDVVWAAAKALGTIGDPKAVDPLIDRLENLMNIPPQSRGWYYMSHVNALGMIGDERAVEPLVEVLNNEELWHLHDNAARALGEIGDPRAIDAIRNYAKRDYSNEWVVACALARLGEADKNPQLYDSIIDGLRGDYRGRNVRDDSQELRSMKIDAIRTLGKMGNHGQIDILRYTYQNPSGDDTVFWSAWALAMLGDSTGIYALETGYGIGVDDNRIWDRFNAVVALGEIGNKNTIVTLMDIAESSKNDRIRAAAWEAVEKIQVRHA